MGDKILIVDDQDSNLRLLELTLRRGGFTSVTTTADPSAVGGLHRDHQYDLILLDLVMPGMDGFEVLAGLTGARVMVMSADPRQEARARKAGATDFMGKPFELKDVVSRVTTLLAA